MVPVSLADPLPCIPGVLSATARGEPHETPESQVGGGPGPWGCSPLGPASKPITGKPSGQVVRLQWRDPPVPRSPAAGLASRPPLPLLPAPWAAARSQVVGLPGEEGGIPTLTRRVPAPRPARCKGNAMARAGSQTRALDPQLPAPARPLGPCPGPCSPGIGSRSSVTPTSSSPPGLTGLCQ